MGGAFPTRKEKRGIEDRAEKNGMDWALEYLKGSADDGVAPKPYEKLSPFETRIRPYEPTIAPIDAFADSGLCSSPETGSFGKDPEPSSDNPFTLSGLFGL